MGILMWLFKDNLHAPFVGVMLSTVFLKGYASGNNHSKNLS